MYVIYKHGLRAICDPRFLMCIPIGDCWRSNDYSREDTAMTAMSSLFKLTTQVRTSTIATSREKIKTVYHDPSREQEGCL